VVDLLGGAVPDAVPCSAYLFFKYAEHIDRPYPADAWGEGPAQVVAQARPGPQRQEPEVLSR
jgi:glucarate dehydratase